MSRAAGNRRRSAGVAERNPDPPVLLSRTKKSSSASKLLDFFKNTPSLEEALNDLEQANNYAIKAAEMQRRGLEKLHKWAEDRGNSAISDVSGKMSELFQLLCTQQLLLSQSIANNLQDMKKMASPNADLVELEKKVTQLDLTDKKIEKELFKMKPSTSTNEHGQIIRSKLSERLQLANQKDKAEGMIHQLRNDNEINKMFVFRRSVKGYSDAYVNYAKNVGIIFGATRELAELVPAIATEDVHHLRYEGGQVSQRKVQQVRRSLETPSLCEEKPTSRLITSKKRMVPVSPRKMGSAYKNVSPPPPYSPGTKYQNQ